MTIRREGKLRFRRSGETALSLEADVAVRLRERERMTIGGLMRTTQAISFASELIATIYGSVTQFRETKVLADDPTLVVVKMLWLRICSARGPSAKGCRQIGNARTMLESKSPAEVPIGRRAKCADGASQPLCSEGHLVTVAFAGGRLPLR
jgi:hypothetical protein